MLATATRTRRTNKSKVSRSARLSADKGILHLIIGWECFGYYLETLAHDFGAQARCYRLEKFYAKRQQGEPTSYDLVIQPKDPGFCTCECKGFLRHGQCKHVESLLALHEAGRLS